MNRFLLCLFFLISFQVNAQIFRAEVTDYGGLDSFPAVKSVIDAYVKEFQDDVNENIPSGSTSRIMKGMSNATVISGKGVTSDYSSHMEKYMISFGMGGGLDLDKPTGTDSELSGVGITPALMVGANLHNLGVKKFATLDPKRVNAYVHYMQFGEAQSLDPWIGMDSEVSVRAKSLGARMAYDWKLPKEHRHFTWGGIRLSWAYFYNESQFNFEHDLNKRFEINGDQTIQGQVTGRPKYQVDVVAHSIPLEISSDITFFKFLTVFGGLGADFNYGKAKGKAKGNGDLSPLVCTDSGAICGGGRNLTFQVQATVEDESRVDPFLARAFGGLQINLPYIQLYGQVDKPIGNEILGLGVGIRFVR